jgi:putative methionine-R-sulfoxide reductase with GAF domain
MPTRTTSEGKPILDEPAFQRLLAAAYVVQENRQRQRIPLGSDSEETFNENELSSAASDYARTLAEIIETQHQILVQRLDLNDASGMIVEQLQRLTGASGAAFGLLDHEHLVYRAVSGATVAELGSALPSSQSISANTLQQGIAVRCANVDAADSGNTALAKRARAGSFVSVPVFQDDRVAGALELLFAKRDGFQEDDVRTCHLMAGVVTEALTRDADEHWKRNLEADRVSMLQALEKLQPQLDRLAKDAAATKNSQPVTAVETTASTPKAPQKNPASPQAETKAPSPRVVITSDHCARCGNAMAAQEVYCGACGTLRDRMPVEKKEVPPEQAALKNAPVSGEAHPEDIPPATRALEPIELPEEILALIREEPEFGETSASPADDLLKLLPPESWESETLPEKSESASEAATDPEAGAWTSAAKTGDWLRSIARQPTGPAWVEWIREHRGDIALVVAVLLVLLALLWNRPKSATAALRPTSATMTTETTANDGETADSDLPFWERALISLGLAETPQTPVRARPLGNPEVRVWVDLHSALYHCPGTEPYGKGTGKYVTQREAQADRFDPASGKACE